MVAPLPTPGTTPGPDWAAMLNAAVKEQQDLTDTGRLSEAQQSATYVPQVNQQPAETDDVVLFRIKPFTTGWGDFKVLASSYPNTDGSYNHAAWIGWNQNRNHGSEIAGKPALTIGFEDHFYDPAAGGGDGNHGPEFYVEHALPDGSASLFRPFYARGSNETGHNRWNIQFDMGTDGNGVFSVFAGKGNPVIFQVSPTGAQFTKNLLITGSGGMTVAPASGQALFTINGANPTVLYENSGTASWFLQSLGVNNFSFVDRSSRTHLALTYGATAAAALSAFGSSVRVDGNVGFYGKTPVAQQLLATGAAHTVDDVITALQALGLVKQA